MNFSYKIGLRAFKSMIAVFLCVVIVTLLGRDNAFYASVAAVVCLQQTYKDTFKFGMNRLTGTVIGGILGYITLLVFMNQAFYGKELKIILIPAVLLIAIYICNVLKRGTAVPICSIVLLSIIAAPNSNIINVESYVLTRVMDNAMGIGISMLLNRIAPFTPKGITKEVTDEKNTDKEADNSDDISDFTSSNDDMATTDCNEPKDTSRT